MFAEHCNLLDPGIKKNFSADYFHHDFQWPRGLFFVGDRDEFRAFNFGITLRGNFPEFSVLPNNFSVCWINAIKALGSTDDQVSQIVNALPLNGVFEFC